MDMNSLDLNLLKSLHVLLVERSVTGAARRIGISQPAMSAQLARLRRQFGDPLLVSSGRSLVPTVRAEALQEPLEAILQDLFGLVQTQSTFDPLTAQDTVFLGGTDYVHAMISGYLAAHLRVEAPGIRLAMMPFVHGSLARDLETGRMSAAIVTSFVRLDQAKSVTLQSERFAFVQRSGHPRGAAPPTLDEFCSLQHVLVSPEGGGFSGAVDQALDDLGRKRHVAVSLPSFLLA
ncbi:MAG: LysR family transcriptional regulator, partial [Pseudomonadota bacterium]